MGSVLSFAGTTALESAAPLPLAFAIVDSANCLATGGTAETRRPALRFGGRFITPRPGAQKSWKKILLRDHAPPQLEEDLVFVAKVWRADGASVPPRRAGF